MKYHLVTYGCQMNQSDSEKIAGVLEKSKYKPTSKIKEADLVIINACSVRQSAVDRVWGKVNIFRKLKKRNKNLKTVLTGCISKKDRRKFEKEFDLILNIQDLPKFPFALSKKNKVKGPKKRNYFNIKAKNLSNFSLFIPISSGCNNFCSYCVVPFTRGSLQCRDHKDILKEIKEAIHKGFKEVWLLGQNVNDYVSPTDPKINFSKLLKKINDIPGNFWIRFTSPHPKDFSDELIDTMANSKKVTKYLNLPVQSGDNQILKKMYRPYTAGHYKNLVKKIRKKIPGITLSTDVIVGFPGETKKQFENTVKLFKAMKFDMAYISQYSERPGTAAAKLKDTISHRKKGERDKILTGILKKTAQDQNKKYLGKEVEVLIEKIKKDFLIGKTKTYKTVKAQLTINNQQLTIKPGYFVKIKVIDTLPWGLKGEIKNKKKRPGLIVILGPTASGKTDLSIKLAKKFDGEIISADSRQVYKGMDIGTGKITKKEMQGIPHYCIDVASPKRKFNVARYQKLAIEALNKIIKKGKVPILCGGTGFYIQAVVDRIVIPEVKPDWELRKKLGKKSAQELFSQLKKLDPKRAKTIDKKNKRRLIRALEIILKTKRPVPAFETNPLPYHVLMIGIKKEKKELKKLIKRRLSKRLKRGLTAEVKRLKKSGLSWKRLQEFGLEYRWIAKYLQKQLDYQEMSEKLQKEIEHYANRQITWFKKDERIIWIKDYKIAEKLVKDFLKQKDC
ncbi:tRNA (N6-isopentenyl adenosine(37)-C2)-methylthiotransferase MiaB [Patescibacteria group bacterium]